MSTNESHEVRELKYRNKQLGKQLGRAGETIHTLRTEVAWLRSALTGPARSTAEATFQQMEARIKQLNEELNELVRDQVDAENAKTDSVTGIH